MTPEQKIETLEAQVKQLSLIVDELLNQLDRERLIDVEKIRLYALSRIAVTPP